MLNADLRDGVFHDFIHDILATVHVNVVILFNLLLTISLGYIFLYIYLFCA